MSVIESEQGDDGSEDANLWSLCQVFFGRVISIWRYNWLTGGSKANEIAAKQGVYPYFNRASQAGHREISGGALIAGSKAERNG